MNMIKDLKQNWPKSSRYNSYYGDSLVCNELTEIIAPIWLVRVIRRCYTRRWEISGGEDRWPYSLGFWYLVERNCGLSYLYRMTIRGRWNETIKKRLNITTEWSRVAQGNWNFRERRCKGSGRVGEDRLWKFRSKIV